jgi:hypothetical protein
MGGVPNPWLYAFFYLFSLALIVICILARNFTGHAAKHQLQLNHADKMIALLMGAMPTVNGIFALCCVAWTLAAFLSTLLKPPSESP